MPSFNVKIAGPFVIFGAFIAVSYFSHVGWWALTGLSFLFGLMTETKWSNFWFILSLIFLLLSIWRMGWVYF